MKTTWRSRFGLFNVLCGFAAVVCAGTVAPIVSAAELDPDSLLEEIGTRRGICIVLGERSEQLVVELAEKCELTLFIQSPNAAEVSAIRKTLDAKGLLGTRIYVAKGDYSRLHLGDNLADAVVLVGSAGGNAALAKSELMRVLTPRGKVIRRSGVTVKQVPLGTGDWSHPYHGPDNNPQGNDKLAKAPFLTQFLATPYYGPMPEVTVSAGGRIFKAFGHVAYKRREWAMLSKLICLNGYNGTLLWERDLTPGFMIHRNTMVATDDTLYLADNESCKLIDTATGKVRDEIVVPKEVGGGPGWKWLAIKDGVLFALVGKKDIIDDVLHGVRDKPGWPWSGMGKAYARKDYPWGFGKTLLAINPATKKILWSYQEEDLLDSRALSFSHDRLFLYSDQKFLAAVDSKSGSLLWKTSDDKLLKAIGPHKKAQNPREGYSSAVYTKADDKVLLFAGSQRSQLVAVSAEDGRLLWSNAEGNFQLVLRDDGIYAMGRTVTSKKFDYTTGKILAELECFRGNCTRATGTVDSIFTRGYRHSGTMRFDVVSTEARRFPAMRPACQDGVVSANGLLYWGPWMCDCNHSLVGIISLGNAGSFQFEQQATNDSRLERTAADPKRVEALETSANDWPTYRKNNRRSAQTTVAIAKRLQTNWTFQPNKPVQPTAPVTAGGFVFFSGADGIVHALDAQNGGEKWTAYTGGAVNYPPAIWKGRLYVGSADGWVYAFEATTGRELWRFRAAPIERRIPVYGKLASNWPVAGGVLVNDGVVYTAAGIASHDGTHVYALDAITGEIKWQNNESGNLLDEGVVCGISVQGHMLLDDDRLYMAGGNVVSPAIFNADNGKCLNVLTNEWQKGPRGSELFLAAGKVRVVDKLLYSPREYIPSRYYGKYLVEASSGDVLIQGTESSMMRVELGSVGEKKPKVLWQNSRFVATDAVVLTKNAVLTLGRLKSDKKDGEPKSVLAALKIEDGQPLWTHPLDTLPASWGLAVDRKGRILVTLDNGTVLCFAE